MRSIVLVTITVLAGCGSGSQAPTPAQTSSPATSASSPAAASYSSAALAPAVPTETPSPETTKDVAVLANHDCRTVAQAYFQAIERNDFAFAARVWNDPAIGETRLKSVFADYDIPHIEISKVQEEGAAGSLYCTVSGKLGDVADVNKPARSGEIVLRRVNDVPGATPDQLRWTIRSSTFIQKLERSG